MDGMDCCKAALMETQTPQASVARLCCTLNCSKEGTTPNGVGFAPQFQLMVITYPPTLRTLMAAPLLTRRFDSSHGPPTDSHPAYIRNLALLI
jgi:hypothetical protein